MPRSEFPHVAGMAHRVYARDVFGDLGAASAFDTNVLRLVAPGVACRADRPLPGNPLESPAEEAAVGAPLPWRVIFPVARATNRPTKPREHPRSFSALDARTVDVILPAVALPADRPVLGALPCGSDSVALDAFNPLLVFSDAAELADGAFLDHREGDVIISDVCAAPSITSVKAKTGKPGSPATIKGTNFGTDSKKATVYVGTKKAKITGKIKSTQIKFTIPRMSKGTYDLYVVVNGKTSNKVWFTVK